MQMTRLRDRAADPRVVDAALVAGCLVLTALAVKTPWSVLPLPVVAVAGIVGSAAQWTRRRRPALAALAGAITYAVSGNPGPWLLGLYTAASRLPRRLAWACGAVSWAGFAAQLWIDEGTLLLDDVLAALLATALVALVGGYAGARNELIASLRERAEQAETERLLRDEQARAAERDRIAREMHDMLAHKVSLIALYAGALELHAVGDARLKEGTGLIRATAREALQELRHVLGLLYVEQAGEPFSDLASLVQASTRAGQEVTLHDRAGPLPPVTARVVYRVVQEGLTNARKHAPGGAVTVTVDQDDDDRSVTVKVHNKPGDAAPADLPGSGSGLVGLAERIRLIGGTMRSGPVGTGWELCAVVPQAGDAS